MVLMEGREGGEALGEREGGYVFIICHSVKFNRQNF